jgi:4-hydroxythreonine-4-phosphate dehydrogenase
VRFGKPSRAGGRAAVESLEQAIALLRAGQADALATAPVSKESFALADYGFPGHTEWLAKECNASEVAMLMVAGPLRAILMTRHIPLSQVSKHLAKDLIMLSARLGDAFVRHYVTPHPQKDRPLPPGEGRVRRPRLVLCGLNPHAGDHGLIGHEEEKIFRPALRALQKKGIRVSGPISADAVFSQMTQGRYDLALACYHDQGMIPLKVYAPERIVNVTLGLPFIRTSPGHGTAYDIAGKGVADPRPMVEAILLAAKYARGA